MSTTATSSSFDHSSQVVVSGELPNEGDIWDISMPMLQKALRENNFDLINTYCNTVDDFAYVRQPGQTEQMVSSDTYESVRKLIKCYTAIINQKEYVYYEDLVAFLREKLKREIERLDDIQIKVLNVDYQHYTKVADMIRQYSQENGSLKKGAFEEYARALFSRNAMVTFVGLGVGAVVTGLDKYIEILDAEDAHTQSSSLQTSRQKNLAIAKMSLGVFLAIGLPVIRSLYVGWNKINRGST